MTLQKRSAAPGKARRAASKGKPRRAAAAKAAKRTPVKPVTKKSSPRKNSSASSKPSSTRRYSDREEGTVSRKQERLSERSKLRAKRFQDSNKKKDEAKAARPKRKFDEKPKRDFKPREDRSEKPKRDFKPREDKPKRKYEEKPKREYKPRVERFEKPKREFKPREERRERPAREVIPPKYERPVRKPAVEIVTKKQEFASTTFRALGVPASVDNALSAQGITEPFPIQAATLPDSIAGHDILGRGQTGSGKTLAFSLALLTKLNGQKARPHHPLAIVLTPTRELAQQIDEVLHPLSRAVGHESVVVAGGMAYGKQINAMRKSVAIVVATPGRLIDLLNKGEVILDDLQIAVLDEADQMADMGFLPVVSEILDQANPEGQRLLFSATLDRGVDALVKKYLKNPKTHALQDSRASVDTMEHFVLVCEPSQKDDITAQIAARHGKTILFVKTQRGADRVADKLAHAGVAVGALHGGKSQAVRTRTLQLFKETPDAVLVATDVASRGIHVDGISLVVHVDPPQDEKDYLHRSGRTARAGESGVVVSLGMPRQQRMIAAITSKAGVKPHVVKVAPLSEELVEITGAQEPSGIPYVPPVIEKPKSPRRNGGGNRRGGFKGRRGPRRD